MLNTQGEVLVAVPLSEVPSEGRIAAKSVCVLRIAVCAVRPGAGAGCPCRGIGQRVWVVDIECDSRVAELDILKVQVGDLERRVGRKSSPLLHGRSGTSRGSKAGEASDGRDEMHVPNVAGPVSGVSKVRSGKVFLLKHPRELKVG